MISLFANEKIYISVVFRTRSTWRISCQSILSVAITFVWSVEGESSPHLNSLLNRKTTIINFPSKGAAVMLCGEMPLSQTHTDSRNTSLYIGISLISPRLFSSTTHIFIRPPLPIPVSHVLFKSSWKRKWNGNNSVISGVWYMIFLDTSARSTEWFLPL